MARVFGHFCLGKRVDIDVLPRNEQDLIQCVEASSNSLDQEGEGNVRYAVVIENAQSNFSAYVPDLPGCTATGQTIAEGESEIREAIQFRLKGMIEDGESVSPPSSHVEYIEIAA